MNFARSLAYMDVGVPRKQDAVAAAYMDVGVPREQDAEAAGCARDDRVWADR